MDRATSDAGGSPRTTILVLALSIVLVGLTMSAPGASAAPEPVSCHPNFPGGYTCTVQAGGCQVEYTASPYGDSADVDC